MAVVIGNIRLGNKRSYSDHKPEPGEIVVEIDRPHNLGNPFAVQARRTRAQAIEEYREYLEHHIARKHGPVYNEVCRIVQHLLDGRDVILMCWCHPLPCHGAVIIEAVTKLLNRKTA